MICTYCKTPNNLINDVCSFCEADNTKVRPTMKNVVTILNTSFKYNNLKTYHTYDLLLLLKDIRHERSSAYETMTTAQRLLRNAPEIKVKLPDYENSIKDAESMYREETARMNLIQEILIDRIGYYPKRIDDKLLNAWHNRLKK